MISNIIKVAFSVVCIIANLHFLGQWQKDEKHSRDVILQNMIGLPFLFILGGGMAFISPNNDPALGLWALILLPALLLAALGYLYYVIVKPLIHLGTKNTQTKLYRINIAVLLCEALFTPLVLSV